MRLSEPNFTSKTSTSTATAVTVVKKKKKTNQWRLNRLKRNHGAKIPRTYFETFYYCFDETGRKTLQCDVFNETIVTLYESAKIQWIVIIKIVYPLASAYVWDINTFVRCECKYFRKKCTYIGLSSFTLA